MPSFCGCVGWRGEDNSARFSCELFFSVILVARIEGVSVAAGGLEGDERDLVGPVQLEGHEDPGTLGLHGPRLFRETRQLRFAGGVTDAAPTDLHNGRRVFAELMKSTFFELLKT